MGRVLIKAVIALKAIMEAGAPQRSGFRQHPPDTETKIPICSLKNKTKLVKAVREISQDWIAGSDLLFE